MQRNFIQTITSNNRQDILAQRSCPACFGVSHPVQIPRPSSGCNNQTNPTNSTSPVQPLDSTNQTEPSPDNTNTSDPSNSASNSTNPAQPLDSTDPTQPPNSTNTSKQAENRTRNDTIKTTPPLSNTDINRKTQTPDRPDNQNTQPTDDKNKVFICLDGNFQHRHHERASKNYLELETQPLFIHPEELQTSNSEILQGELDKRASKKAVGLFPLILF
jgi:hypothetical protein